MVVEVDGPVFRKEHVKFFVIQCVWVGACAREDHEICNIDDANSEVWSAFAQEGSGSDDFECDLYANANKYP